MIVENKPGAGGAVGAEYVAKAAGDGYTLLMGVTGSNAIAQSLYPNLRYHVINDFKPVTMLVSAPLVLAVNTNVKANTVKEYIALSKTGPRPLTYGSAGNGTSMHLTGEMFKLATGARLEHIPYRGNGPKVTDLLGGQIDSSFGDLLVLQPHIESGKLRALAVTSAARLPQLPNVPTMQEAGYPHFELGSWFGVPAHAGTPRAIVDQLNAGLQQIAAQPAFEKRLVELGAQRLVKGPADFQAYVVSESKKWSAVVKASGASLD